MTMSSNMRSVPGPKIMSVLQIVLFTNNISHKVNQLC